jgi:nucleotide-binding universal stress UspA family protein
MTGPIVVGYTATPAGEDAVALGARLAKASDAELDLVVVLPSDGRSVITPPDAGYERYLLDQAEGWLGTARERVGEVVTHRTHVRAGESFAEGLVEAASDLGASHVVVGAANGGLRGKHRLGTVATQLLHSSDVPVVLAPEGSRLIDPDAGISRVTAAIGKRVGSDVLLAEAAALAKATGSPLRIISLVTVDLPSGVDTGVIRLAGAAHAQEVVTLARAAVADSVQTDAVIADGESIEDAVRGLDWLPDEICMVGSSRLARPRRLFLGSTAAKMLHELPVPLVVVPRTHAQDAEVAVP